MHRSKLIICTVIEDGPTIIPILSPEQGAAIQGSFKILATGPFEGARAHFCRSDECFSTNSNQSATATCLDFWGSDTAV